MTRATKPGRKRPRTRRPRPAVADRSRSTAASSRLPPPSEALVFLQWLAASDLGDHAEAEDR